jgi:hypothetical protein
MSPSFTAAGSYLEHLKPIWSQNVSLSIESTQDHCQQIVTELSTILEKHGEWDIRATFGSCRRLNMLSKNLRVLKAHQDLLLRALDLIPVVAMKPAEHESLDSITVPPHLQGWWDERMTLDWSGYEELRRRLKAARQAAQERFKWSCRYTNSYQPFLEALHLTKECSAELSDHQVSKASLQTTDMIYHLTMDDWSTTQSTTGTMTPAEDWSDLGSETTEIIHHPDITRHSLQLCGYATASFLRLVEDFYTNNPGHMDLVDTEGSQRLHNAYSELVIQLLHSLEAPVPFQGRGPRSSPVRCAITKSNLYECLRETRRFVAWNNDIEQSFSHLPDSTPVSTADIEAMHTAYSRLVETLLVHLTAPVPFQDDRFTSTAVAAPVPASVPVSAPEVPIPVDPQVQNDNYVDKTLKAIIDSMESELTKEDIMKPVFYWSSLDETNGFKRADMMKLAWAHSN